VLSGQIAHTKWYDLFPDPTIADAIMDRVIHNSYILALDSKKSMREVCGKNYKRKTTHGRISWNCSTYLKFGKAFCHTKQIPEDILLSIVTEVLGLTKFDETVFEQKIKEIQAIDSNLLVFVFRDGQTVQKEWQNKSRSESWNEKARQQARERQLKYLERRKASCIQQEQ